MSPYRARDEMAQAFLPPRAPAPTFQFADFLHLLEARRVLIVRIALATILFALAVAFFLPSTYASSAVVMLDPRKSSITDLSAVLTPQLSDPAAVQNQIQIITSRELAANVADRLKLQDDPEFNPDLAGPGLPEMLGDLVTMLNPKNWFEIAPVSGALGRERVIENLQRHVRADGEGLSTAIAITATARQPVKAALIANAFAGAYVQSQLADKIGATIATTGWLNKRLQDLAQQLQIQQEAVQRYKAEHNLNDSPPGNSIVDQQMVGINAQIVAARSELAEKQAIANRIRQLAAAGNPADIAQIVSSPLIVQLRGQQAALLAQEGDLNSRYGPLHPKMQAIQEQKRDLDFKIAQEVGRLAASAANDVMVAQAHLNSLQGSLGGTESTARTQNMARVQLQALESNASSTRTMYEAFVQRLRQSQNLDEAQTPESRIISSAPVPLRPAGPKRMLIVGASIPLGLLLGTFTALLLEKLAPRIPARYAPRGALIAPGWHASGWAAQPQHPAAMWNGPPVLGEVNNMARLEAADYVLDYPASKYAHAMVRLVRQLQSEPGAEEGAAVIAVTSAANSESRSAIAVSLARAASRMGKKAVILDCAYQRLASRAIKAPVRAGLYEVLTGAVRLNQALAKDPRGETYLLSTPKWPSPDMFASRAMARLTTVLRGGADFIVIDCGPVGARTQAASIARLADATVLVSPRQMLHSAAMADAARLLERANAPPIGIVTTR
ncbi:MAG TPA: exopolysaccharide transport family protein [Rhizomicrobium sp.]|nr:exopolysaccharide transport family protein [Rhizomicrobium sp.]